MRETHHIPMTPWKRGKLTTQQKTIIKQHIARNRAAEIGNELLQTWAIPDANNKETHRLHNDQPKIQKLHTQGTNNRRTARKYGTTTAA